MIASRTSDEPSPPVHFEGCWSDRERDLVEAAVDEAEETGLPTRLRPQTAPWVATCHDRGRTSMYAASRIGVSRVLAAHTASDLAEEIREFARAKEQYPGDRFRKTHS